MEIFCCFKGYVAHHCREEMVEAHFQCFIKKSWRKTQHHLAHIHTQTVQCMQSKISLQTSDSICIGIRVCVRIRNGLYSRWLSESPCLPSPSPACDILSFRSTSALCQFNCTRNRSCSQETWHSRFCWSISPQELPGLACLKCSAIWGCMLRQINIAADWHVVLHIVSPFWSFCSLSSLSFCSTIKSASSLRLGSLRSLASRSWLSACMKDALMHSVAGKPGNKQLCKIVILQFTCWMFSKAAVKSNQQCLASFAKQFKLQQQDLWVYQVPSKGLWDGLVQDFVHVPISRTMTYCERWAWPNARSRACLKAVDTKPGPTDGAASAQSHCCGVCRVLVAYALNMRALL